jgi:integrase
MDKNDEYPIITKPASEILNDRQLMDYRSHREKFIGWIDEQGKKPKKQIGYANSTVESSAYIVDKFYRWVWSEQGGYTIDITHDHADQYIHEIAATEKSKTHKAKCRKSIKRLFKWKYHTKGGELWDTDLSFNDAERGNPQDYLTRSERTAIREAALEYGSIPSYNSITPSERDQWKKHLSQRFEKPKSEIGVDDWDRANGWKITSLVLTSLDAGLRPIEVKKAVVQWVDIQNGVLRIPKDESSKNEDYWVVGLRDQTVRALDNWIKERSNYNKYNGSDSLWLTQYGNPYKSSSLRKLMHKLCRIAEIPIENRKMSWYTIRHSVGTYMTREDGLSATQEQLRHKSVRTTMRYDHVPVEDRKNALERMDK